MNRSRFLGAMLWGQLGRLGEVGLSLLFIVLVVRWLSQENFSTYTTIVNLISLCAFLVGLGTNEGLMRYIPIALAENALAPFWLFRRFLAARTAACLALAILILLFREQLAFWFNRPMIATDTGLLVVLLVLYNVFEILGTFFLALLQVGRIVLVRLLGQLANILLVAIWFGVAGTAVEPLFISLGLVNLGMFLAGIALLAKGGLFERLQDVPPALKPRAGEIIRFCRDQWVISIFNLGLTGQIDIALLAALSGNILAVPYYSLASLLIGRLYILITAWASSLNSIISTVLVENGKPGLVRYFGYYYRFSLPVHLFPVVGLAAVSAPLTTLVFGERYRDVALLLSLFALQNVVSALLGASICSAFLNTLGRQNIVLRWRSLFSLLNVALDVALIPPLGALGAVIATSLANALVALVEALLLRELFATLRWQYTLKISGGVLLAGLLAFFVGGEGFIWLPVKALVYLGFQVLFFRLVRPLEPADRQLLLNLHPALARLLRFF